VGLLPRDLRGLDGGEVAIIVKAREASLREQARLVAWQIAEMRSLWGTGPRWSAAQVMGEAPPPTPTKTNDLGSLMSLSERAREQREEREEEEAAGWADSFDVPDDLFGDAGADAEGRDP
jgi:hypothetical protein